MPVQGRGTNEIHTGVLCRDYFDDARQVALQMHSHHQKIGCHDDLAGPLFDQRANRLFEIWLSQFEKRSFPQRKAAATRRLLGYSSDAFVGLFDAGAVTEDDQPDVFFRDH